MLAAALLRLIQRMRAVHPAKTGVLFVSSAEKPGADTFIHNLIMRSLDRSRFDVHVACSAGTPGARPATFDTLSTIPDLHLRPSNFGPSWTENSTFDKALASLKLPGALVGFAGLARYVSKHRIAVLHSTDRPRDAVACAVLGKITGAKSVIHAHVKCADWMAGSQRWAMGQVDAIVGVSEFVVGSLVQNGYQRERTHAVLNAIDLPRWEYGQDPAPVRRALGISPGAPGHCLRRAPDSRQTSGRSDPGAAGGLPGISLRAAAHHRRPRSPDDGHEFFGGAENIGRGSGRVGKRDVPGGAFRHAGDDGGVRRVRLAVA